ncbi:MAG TPA: pitrilysin family protein [Jatrophihabitans sp.]|nr:pitrilysin family protein [Jatrophihabitans sp.]
MSTQLLTAPLLRAQRRLPNGLRVVVQHDRHMSGCAVAVNYRAGFRDEPRSRAGFAHLFEHMMFQGSRNVAPGQHFAEIQAAGGAVNGNTFTDHADYFQTGPSAALDRILALEADRMAHLSITEHNLDVQRRVVVEEINLQLHNRAYGGFPWTVLPAALYRGWSNTHNGFGSTDELAAATVAECRSFYEQFYAPGNAAIGVCANADPDELLAAVGRHFAELPARPIPCQPRRPEPEASISWQHRAHEHVDGLAPRPALALGWRLPDARTSLAEYACYTTLSALLTGGTHGALRRLLRAHEAMADTSVGLFGPLMAIDPDTFVLVVHHNRGLRDAVLNTIDDLLTRVSSGDFDDRVEAARLATLTELHQRLDVPAYRVRLMTRGALLFDNAGLAEDYAAALGAVATAGVRSAAEHLRHGLDRGLATLETAGDGR